MKAAQYSFHPAYRDCFFSTPTFGAWYVTFCSRTPIYATCLPSFSTGWGESGNATTSYHRQTVEIVAF